MFWLTMYLTYNANIVKYLSKIVLVTTGYFILLNSTCVGSDARDMIPQEAIESWKQMKQQYNICSGEFTWFDIDSDTHEKKRVRLCNFFVNGKSFLEQWKRCVEKRETTFTKVICDNPNYSFFIDRKDENDTWGLRINNLSKFYSYVVRKIRRSTALRYCDPVFGITYLCAGPWYIKEINSSENGQIANALNMSKKSGFAYLIANTYSLFSTPLVDVINDADFEVVSFTRNQDGQQATMAYQWKIPASFESPKELRDIKGTVVFEISKCWAIIENTTFSIHNPLYVNKINFTFSGINANVPVVYEIQEKISRPDVAGEIQKYYEVSNIIFAPTPPSRFTLSHYGLPEPDFEVRRTRFQMFRYVLLAVGAVLIGIALYRMYEQRRTLQT